MKDLSERFTLTYVINPEKRALRVAAIKAKRDFEAAQPEKSKSVSVDFTKKRADHGTSRYHLNPNL
jgi:hypothetical protein